MISLIAALSENYVIGMKGIIPWKLPADLAWFKSHTLKKPIIMGRLTWESIGYPLSDRLNIVLSKKKVDSHVIWASSIEEAVSICNNAKEIMVIGGGYIYKQFFSKAEKLYLTHIKAVFQGDVYFPIYEKNKWKVIFNESHKADLQNFYDYQFEILELK